MNRRTTTASKRSAAKAHRTYELWATGLSEPLRERDGLTLEEALRAHNTWQILDPLGPQEIMCEGRNVLDAPTAHEIEVLNKRGVARQTMANSDITYDAYTDSPFDVATLRGGDRDGASPVWPTRETAVRRGVALPALQGRSRVAKVGQRARGTASEVRAQERRIPRTKENSNATSHRR